MLCTRVIRTFSMAPERSITVLLISSLGNSQAVFRFRLFDVVSTSWLSFENLRVDFKAHIKLNSTPTSKSCATTVKNNMAGMSCFLALL